MHILALLNQPNYFPDVDLRMRIFCLNHLKLKETTEDYEIWSCCYGLDEPTLSSIICQTNRREDFISIHLNECFLKDEKEKIYRVKEELKEKLNEKIQKCPGILGGISEYEKSINYKSYYNFYINKIELIVSLYCWIKT